MRRNLLLAFLILAVPFTATATPTVTSLSSSLATAGGPGFDLQVFGSGFHSTYSVNH
jgi:hypothetical protein